MKKSFKIIALILVIGTNIFTFCFEDNRYKNIIYDTNDNIVLTSSNFDKDVRERGRKEKRLNYKPYNPSMQYEKPSVSFYYRGQAINFEVPVLMQYNRYYLPIEETISKLGASLEYKEEGIIINFKEVKTVIDTPNNLMKQGQKIKKLRVSPVCQNGIWYMSLIDFTEALNLKTKWDHTKKSVILYEDDAVNTTVVKKGRRLKPALIRLEDVAAGILYTKEENLEKFRIVADYLNSQGMYYHIAWIPRYVNPEKKIDNDLTKENNIENTDFLFTLDYIINRNGIIGIHGYTHQFGDEESIIGTEFSEKYNTTETETRSRVEAAIECAEKLNIPYKFFESPHYNSTKFHQSIIEQYFDYVYEPCVGVWNKKPLLSQRNKSTFYIPTPLSYVKGKDVEDMIKRIDEASAKQEFISFFYHPSKELDYINLWTDENNKPRFNYSEDSILHKIVKDLKSKDYTLIRVSDIR
ncbi:DUF2334 domain-containing protein [Desnuesiella massiliensis]|uniref:DUF2334 domain-containing protein n=1 Tax=Desnuesiella massiliensis TaxID=1650662 RepID=UPI0006E22C8B|nr:DUF2334 domain-containing protein [Desnuesiella massiliensis]